MSRVCTKIFAGALALWGVCAFSQSPEPKGELLASIEMVEGWKPIERRTGWWFYAERTTGNLIGPRITGYEYRDGKQVDEFGGGSQPDLFEAIYHAKLQAFDFEKEADIAHDRLSEQAAARDEVPFISRGRDGARFVVTIVTAAGTFKYEGWNPGDRADALAAGSEKIARLKQVFDQLRAFYTDSKLQF
ncbi:MAG TPA: hypothetical protein VF033_12190 [Steroidobacteraceae bacterium]|jgi:hypothetical protein